MNKNDNRFPQQEAPEKNTDNAYVQVGKNGEPVMPETGGDKERVETQTTGREQKDNDY